MKPHVIFAAAVLGATVLAVSSHALLGNLQDAKDGKPARFNPFGIEYKPVLAQP